MKYEIIGNIGDRVLLKRNTTFDPFIVVTGYDKETESWLQGNYFKNLQDACLFALSRLGFDTPTNAYAIQFKDNYMRTTTYEFLRENYNVSEGDAWMWACDIREKMESDEYYSNLEMSIIEDTKKDWVKEV